MAVSVWSGWRRCYTIRRRMRSTPVLESSAVFLPVLDRRRPTVHTGPAGRAVFHQSVQLAAASGSSRRFSSQLLPGDVGGRLYNRWAAALAPFATGACFRSRWGSALTGGGMGDS